MFPDQEWAYFSGCLSWSVLIEHNSNIKRYSICGKKRRRGEEKRKGGNFSLHEFKRIFRQDFPSLHEINIWVFNQSVVYYNRNRKKNDDENKVHVITIIPSIHYLVNISKSLFYFTIHDIIQLDKKILTLQAERLRTHYVISLGDD